MSTGQEQQQALEQAFFQRGKDRERDFEAKAGGLVPKLVHYTSSEVAFSIITGKSDETRCVWLRNATEMNDFSEVAFGQQMLISALQDNDLHTSFLAACREVHPDLGKIFDIMNQEFNSIKSNTYLLSLSRHTEEELKIGRLSMWRAYGGESNVCLLFNTDVFLKDQYAYDVTIAPVDYRENLGVVSELIRIRDALVQYKSILRDINPNVLMANLKFSLDIMLLSTKHPSFREEEEWRLIYRPPPPPNVPNVPSRIVCHSGIVQRIYYLPVKNVPERGLINADLNEILHGVIIGPTPNPPLVVDAFITLLREAGVADAERRVWPSWVPLRR